MNKLLEWGAVAVLSIGGGFLLVACISDLVVAGVVRDCEQMGQSRMGKTLLKCEVVKKS